MKTKICFLFLSLLCSAQLFCMQEKEIKKINNLKKYTNNSFSFKVSPQKKHLLLDTEEKIILYNFKTKKIMALKKPIILSQKKDQLFGFSKDDRFLFHYIPSEDLFFSLEEKVIVINLKTNQKKEYIFWDEIEKIESSFDSKFLKIIFKNKNIKTKIVFVNNYCSKIIENKEYRDIDFKFCE